MKNWTSEKALRLKEKRRQQLLSPRNLKILELYNQGMMSVDIGDKFGISRQRVEEIVKSMTTLDNI